MAMSRLKSCLQTHVLEHSFLVCKTHLQTFGPSDEVQWTSMWIWTQKRQSGPTHVTLSFYRDTCIFWNTAQVLSISILKIFDFLSDSFTYLVTTWSTKDLRLFYEGLFAFSSHSSLSTLLSHSPQSIVSTWTFQYFLLLLYLNINFLRFYHTKTASVV